MTTKTSGTCTISAYVKYQYHMSFVIIKVTQTKVFWYDAENVLVYFVALSMVHFQAARWTLCCRRARVWLRWIEMVRTWWSVWRRPCRTWTSVYTTTSSSTSTPLTRRYGNRVISPVHGQEPCDQADSMLQHYSLCMPLGLLFWNPNSYVNKFLCLCPFCVPDVCLFPSGVCVLFPSGVPGEHQWQFRSATAADARRIQPSSHRLRLDRQQPLHGREGQRQNWPIFPQQWQTTQHHIKWDQVASIYCPWSSERVSISFHVVLWIFGRCSILQSVVMNCWNNIM